MGNSIHFVEAYFTEEKIESIFFITLGIIALTLACIFLFIIGYSFFKGVAVPLLLIGSIQITVGTIVYSQSPKDIVRVTGLLRNEQKKIKTEELPRMEKVMENFTLYKWIEIALIIGGIILFILFYSSQQTFWKGLALGLLIQACIMLTLDMMAEKRGEIYLNKLHLIESILISPLNK